MTFTRAAAAELIEVPTMGPRPGGSVVTAGWSRTRSLWAAPVRDRQGLDLRGPADALDSHGTCEVEGTAEPDAVLRAMRAELAALYADALREWTGA